MHRVTPEITTSLSPEFHWLKDKKESIRFLGPLADFFDGDVSFFIPSQQTKLSRQKLDGTWCIKGSNKGMDVAVIWSDFRVKGASISKSVATTVVAFLAEIESTTMPLLISMNTMGVRFMEGRTIFAPAFSILPAIKNYQKKHFVLTLTQGNVLGIGALIYGMGHYRLAISEGACINLAGPEVCKMVFGQNTKFEDISSTEVQFKQTGLIHEMEPDIDAALQRIQQLFHTFFKDQTHQELSVVVPPIETPECGVEKNVIDMMSNISDSWLELFVGYDDRVRVFVATLHGCQFGVLMNPPGNPNNMARERTLSLWSEALNIFEELQLPVLSLFDTPGADPRVDGSNRLIIQKLIEVSDQIIEYPYEKLGIAIGRFYGGACVLGIPKIFGSKACFALEGSSAGVMHDSIIDHLLSSSVKLKKQWSEVAATQTADMQDMIDAGIIDRVIKKSAMKDIILGYLLQL